MIDAEEAAWAARDANTVNDEGSGRRLHGMKKWGKKKKWGGKKMWRKWTKYNKWVKRVFKAYTDYDYPFFKKFDVNSSGRISENEFLGTFGYDPNV